MIRWRNHVINEHANKIPPLYTWRHQNYVKRRSNPDGFVKQKTGQKWYRTRGSWGLWDLDLTEENIQTRERGTDFYHNSVRPITRLATRDNLLLHCASLDLITRRHTQLISPTSVRSLLHHHQCHHPLFLFISLQTQNAAFSEILPIIYYTSPSPTAYRFGITDHGFGTPQQFSVAVYFPYH